MTSVTKHALKRRSGDRSTIGQRLRSLFTLSILVLSGHASADSNTYSTLENGLYLVRAGDCAACHTVEEDKPFAGNWTMPTPFGTIYTPNLTPDEETGIGLWTSDDFYRAMHEGRGDENERLYPAFPYVHYTLITRADSDAMYAYLQTLEPIRNVVREPEFIWPLSWRFMMSGWNLLNFEPGTIEPDPERSEAWNRGRYLVDGLGHCGMCHTPKNLIGAQKGGEAVLTGGMAEGWWSPSLTNDMRDGIGRWTQNELIEYLKHGRNKHSAAFGPMAVVIEESTRHLNEPDLKAMAEYLASVGDNDDATINNTIDNTVVGDIKVSDDVIANTDANPDAQPGAENDQASLDEPLSEAITQQPKMLAQGQLIYETQCSACHAPAGEGVPHMFGPIAGSALTQSSDPTTLIRLILEGVQAVPTDKYPTPHAMPAFDWKLDDEGVASVTSYIRNAFGNEASLVDAGMVEEQREAH